MATTPLHPHGQIRPYKDALGRTQTAVTGPRGHVLITRASDREAYRVWHSDSLRTLISTRDRAYALQVACNAAGVTI